MTHSSYTVDSVNLTLHHQHRLLILNEEIVKLTLTEYQLLLCLLDKQIAQDDILAENALCNKSELTKAVRQNLEKHINNLRAKIQPYHLSIHRVHRYGYILASSLQYIKQTTGV